jgi:hypothetical protein
MHHHLCIPSKKKLKSASIKERKNEQDREQAWMATLSILKYKNMATFQGDEQLKYNILGGQWLHHWNIFVSVLRRAFATVQLMHPHLLAFLLVLSFSLRIADDSEACLSNVSILR